MSNTSVWSAAAAAATAEHTRSTKKKLLDCRPTITFVRTRWYGIFESCVSFANLSLRNVRFFFVASACVHDVAVFWNWYKFKQHSGWLMVLSRCVHFWWILFSIHVGFIVRQWCLRVWMHGWLLMSRWVCVCVCICVCSGERWFAYSALNRDFARIFCIVLESLLCAVQYFFGW